MTQKHIFQDGITGKSIQFLYLQQMAAIIEVEQAIAGKQDIISLGIKQNLHQQIPSAWILKELREMATDNYNAVADLLGISLTNKILSI